MENVNLPADGAPEAEEIQILESKIDKYHDEFLYWQFGALVGLGAGLYACTTMGITFWMWILCGVIGVVLGQGILSAICAIEKKHNVGIDRQIEKKGQDTKNGIVQANKERDKAVENAKKKAAERYNAYLLGFNEEAQKLSVNFAGSSLAEEVVNWMTNGFAHTIDSADRRSHVEKITVPFIYKVYKDKIVCNIGTYDFKVKRCDELKNPLEQTALARAMASMIQLNITMKYPKDASGTNIVTNISQEYFDIYVATTITYTAINGNYKKVQSWT